MEASEAERPVRKATATQLCHRRGVGTGEDGKASG